MVPLVLSSLVDPMVDHSLLGDLFKSSPDEALRSKLRPLPSMLPSLLLSMLSPDDARPLFLRLSRRRTSDPAFLRLGRFAGL